MKEKLRNIFEENNLVLVDIGEYKSIQDKELKIPKERIVSYKWLLKKLTKPCKACKQEKMSLIPTCCNCNYPKEQTPGEE